MANAYNYRFGQVELVKMAVDSGTVIAVGDMLFHDTDDVKPAADFTWDTDLATTQGGFAAVFVGIAREQSASGDTDSIDVDISSSSVYEFTIASAAVEMDDSFGPDKASGDALLSNVLEIAVNAASVAHPYQRLASAATKCKVKFASAFNAASSNVNANIG
jgi:hypothetical protein